MIETIKVTDMHEAASIARSYGHNYTAWISLLDREDSYTCGRIHDDFKRKGVHHEYRYFRDIEYGPLADVEGPQEEDVHHIINFFRTLKSADMSHHVGVNCMAGIARSTATAMVGWMVCGYQPEIALDKVLAVRLCAYPNERILGHYDKIMKANSKEVVKVWKDSKRGQLVINPAWRID